MSEQSKALKFAELLDRNPHNGEVAINAAEELRRLNAEYEALKVGMEKQANAVTLMRSVNAEVAKTNAEQRVIVELSQLRSQLESEREANSQLTEEVEALKNGEPIAWMNKDGTYFEKSRHDTVYGSHTIPLYTSPQKSTVDELLTLLKTALPHIVGMGIKEQIEKKINELEQGK